MSTRSIQVILPRLKIYVCQTFTGFLHRCIVTQANERSVYPERHCYVMQPGLTRRNAAKSPRTLSIQNILKRQMIGLGHCTDLAVESVNYAFDTHGSIEEGGESLVCVTPNLKD